MGAYRYKIGMTLHVHACYAVIVAQAKLLIDRCLHCLRCLTAMVALTKERKAELRAKKSLETGDTSFKPRGEANKALFEKMKEEFDKKAKDINLHTSSEADRIIAATATAVLEVIGKNTQPNPGQTRMAAVMAGPSTAVKVLNSILSDQGIECKGTKTDKAEFLANTIPVHRLAKLLEEHKNFAIANKPAASSATVSTAAPSEQLESDRDEGMENQSSDSGESSDSDESSDSEEPMPPAKPASQKSVSKDANQDEESSDAYRRKRKRPINALTSQETKKVAREINPNANVVWSKTCDDKEKEHLRKPISDVTALLKNCYTFFDVKSTFEQHPLLTCSLGWPKGYELNWKDDELAVYIHQESPYAFQLGELLCKVLRKV